MNKRAQVIIVILWVLIILAVMAVAAGQRVSMAVRLVSYQRDGLKALYLAEAQVNKAIASLEGHLSRLKEEPLSTVDDEERKININDPKADEDLLRLLFEECKVTNAGEMAKSIVYWRGGVVTDPPIYTDLGYNNKGKRFANVEELVLLKGLKEARGRQPEEFRKVMGLITVYGGGRVNVNTCSEEVLQVLMKASIAKAYPASPSPIQADELVRRVLAYRDAHPFADSELQSVVDKTGLDEGAFNSILGQLKNYITHQSQHFRIIATGKASPSGAERVIECVYDREGKNIVFWHES